MFRTRRDPAANKSRERKKEAERKGEYVVFSIGFFALFLSSLGCFFIFHFSFLFFLPFSFADQENKKIMKRFCEWFVGCRGVHGQRTPRASLVLARPSVRWSNLSPHLSLLSSLSIYLSNRSSFFRAKYSLCGARIDVVKIGEQDTRLEPLRTAPGTGSFLGANGTGPKETLTTFRKFYLTLQMFEFWKFSEFSGFYGLLYLYRHFLLGSPLCSSVYSYKRCASPTGYQNPVVKRRSLHGFHDDRAPIAYGIFRIQDSANVLWLIGNFV